jgi:hypothetical protein
MMFKKLFTITCTHQYFTNGQCSDLQIEPTAECSTLLKNYHMLFKQEDISTYSILLRRADTEINMPSLTSALTLYIFISGDEFYNYTKYPVINSKLTAGTRTTKVTNNRVNNGTILLFSGMDSNTDSSSFVVSEIAKPSPLLFQNRKLYGIISITPPASFCNYILTLEAAAVKWRYYIIADKSVMDIAIKEKEQDPPADPSDKIVFNNITDAMQTDAIYEAVKTSFPDAGVFINESDTEVLSVQRPGKIIQLWNATDKAHELLLMDNLPVPSCRDNGQQVVYVQSKNNNF